MRRAVLSISQILAWADAFHKRTGRWPNLYSGAIAGSRGEKWRRIDNALRLGLRGLRGGSSLAQLLGAKRHVRNNAKLPLLTEKQILAWADAHRRRTKSWPTSESGPIRRVTGETWKAIDHALRLGMRSLPGGSSLARLLAKRRGVRNIQNLPRLTVSQILAWADAYHRKTGTWPTRTSASLGLAPGETWSGVNAALKKGRRSFPGGTSLARLLAKQRGVRNPKQPPPLSLKGILHWALDYQRRTGTVPTRKSGPIPQAAGETWAMINRALMQGGRGLPGKTSLYAFLRNNKQTNQRRTSARK